MIENGFAGNLSFLKKIQIFFIFWQKRCSTIEKNVV